MLLVSAALYDTLCYVEVIAARTQGLQ